MIFVGIKTLNQLLIFKENNFTLSETIDDKDHHNHANLLEKDLRKN